MIQSSARSDATADPFQAVAAVRHPNLVPIIGRERVDGDLRPRFEDDGGTTLDRLPGLPFDRHRAAILGIGILAGLQALQRAGLGHGALVAASVVLSPRGQLRLTGYGLRRFDPAADVAAAGRVLCLLLGVDPNRRPTARRLSPLAAAALDIATGAAGASATSALMAFGDAAGNIGGGFRIERTQAGIARLAVPGTTALAAAVDRVLATPAELKPIPIPPPLATAPPPPPIRVPKPVVEPAPAAALASDAADPVPATTGRRVIAPPPAAAPPRAAAPPTVAVVKPVSSPPPSGTRLPSSGPRWQRGILAGLAAGLLLAFLVAVPHLQDGRRAAAPIAARPTTSVAVGSAAGASATRAAVPAAKPDAVVTNFYSLALGRRFDQALALWDDHLKAAYPPQDNLYQRFADTTVLTVNSASVTQSTDSYAVVATDLTEVTGGVSHHWFGTWRLVRSGDSWLLDQPDFQGA